MPKRITINGISKYATDGSVFIIDKFARSQAKPRIQRYKIPDGKQFGGRVIATNIPTRFARAGILAKSQIFGDLAHADMIRVD